MENALTETTMWQAVVSNDSSYDERFVLAVKTTGIYCRPSCTARLPKRENVEFFRFGAEAEAAGYRPCKRCEPDKTRQRSPQAELVEAMSRYIEERAPRERVTLEELSKQFHHSPYHLQRTFKAVMGITPKQYADSARMRAFKDRLQANGSVTDAIYDSGYSSTSRLYERVSSQMGMIPSIYQIGGQGKTIIYSVADCALGLLMVAATGRGICAVRLGDGRDALIDSLRDEFPKAHLIEDAAILQDAMEAILEHLAGELPDLNLPLDIRATAFQKRVWEELRRIPYGETRTYGQIAAAIQAPHAARAVGNACANNPAALVVPCHRVIRGDGEIGNYRWGADRKRRLLDHERQTANP